MVVKLHRCNVRWAKFDAHACWRVQKALDETATEYTLVEGPWRRAQRGDLERVSGQATYPVIEFADGSTYRDESKAMAARIRAGELLS